jgi:hypothetical protein
MRGSIVQGVSPQSLSEAGANRYTGLQWWGSMPDTVKFVLVLAFLGGAIYGSAWALSHFPPEQTEIVKPLPSEKLRAK